MHSTDRSRFETDHLAEPIEHQEFLELLGELVTVAVPMLNLTRQSPVSDRKGGPRRPGSVYALVLHQMAFSRRSDPARYKNTRAHFAILPDGKILHLHPVSALLHASSGLNPHSVAVEFAGNLPDVRGRCWSPATHGCHRLTDAQIVAGRHLVDHLIQTIGLTHVLAHRQSSRTRDNDPGPDVWYHVGQWAIEQRGMKDGGPAFKVGSGQPILPAWRTWGHPGRPGDRGSLSKFGSRL